MLRHTTPDAWLLIDPRFAEPKSRRVAESVLKMVKSGWTETHPIEPSDPINRSVLARHRIAA